jgi:hypothetical protein
VPEAVITAVPDPNDGCQHPKHVELPTDTVAFFGKLLKINKFHKFNFTVKRICLKEMAKQTFEETPTIKGHISSFSTTH